MGPFKDEDVVYGTRTFSRYLVKFHGVVISDHELNERLNEVMKEEIEDEEVRHGVSG
jgi:hypothetical protein